MRGLSEGPAGSDAGFVGSAAGGGDAGGGVVEEGVDEAAGELGAAAVVAGALAGAWSAASAWIENELEARGARAATAQRVTFREEALMSIVVFRDWFTHHTAAVEVRGTPPTRSNTY